MRWRLIAVSVLAAVGAAAVPKTASSPTVRAAPLRCRLPAALMSRSEWRSSNAATKRFKLARRSSKPPLYCR
jgi:hypothetical protein